MGETPRCGAKILAETRAGAHVLVPWGYSSPRGELTNPAGGTTVPWRAHTGPRLRVAPLSKTTLAWLGAIGTKHPWRTAWEGAKEVGGGQRLPGHWARADLGARAWSSASVGTFQAEVSGPAWGAKAAPILGVAGPAMVTLAGLGAAVSPASWRACCGDKVRLPGVPAPPSSACTR